MQEPSRRWRAGRQAPPLWRRRGERIQSSEPPKGEHASATRRSARAGVCPFRNNATLEAALFQDFCIKGCENASPRSRSASSRHGNGSGEARSPGCRVVIIAPACRRSGPAPDCRHPSAPVQGRGSHDRDRPSRALGRCCPHSQRGPVPQNRRRAPASRVLTAGAAARPTNPRRRSDHTRTAAPGTQQARPGPALAGQTRRKGPSDLHHQALFGSRPQCLGCHALKPDH